MTSSRSVRVAFSLFLLSASLLAGAAARAQSPSPLDPMIADFEAGKVETTAGLAVVPITDEQFGGTSAAKMTIVRPGAHGTRAAMHIAFRLTDDSKPPFSGVWALLGAEGLATDLSAYRGIRFYARSQTPGGAFLAGAGQFSAGQSTLFMTPFEAKPEWTLVELPFDKLQRFFPPGKGPAFVPKDLVSLGISASPRLRGSFDLEIDQWELYK